MEIHFIDVGQGNMILVKIPNSKIILVDCNITLENEESVLEYVEEQIGIEVESRNIGILGIVNFEL